MNYFSGFCFQNEEELFDSYLEVSDFCVAGFSYGAIKAFEYSSISKDRVDKLQLFSPAFFQDFSDKFKRLQTINFRKNRSRYIKNFLSQVKYPSELNLDRYFHEGNIDELEELLNYVWNEERLNELVKKGTEIEVYIGEKDKIINPDSVLEFFRPYANVYYIKSVGHILH